MGSSTGSNPSPPTTASAGPGAGGPGTGQDARAAGGGPTGGEDVEDAGGIASAGLRAAPSMGATFRRPVPACTTVAAAEDDGARTNRAKSEARQVWDRVRLHHNTGSAPTAADAAGAAHRPGSPSGAAPCPRSSPGRTTGHRLGERRAGWAPRRGREEHGYTCGADGKGPAMTIHGGPDAEPKKLLPDADRPLPHKATKPKPRKVETGRRGHR